MSTHRPVNDSLQKDVKDLLNWRFNMRSWKKDVDDSLDKLEDFTQESVLQEIKRGNVTTLQVISAAIHIVHSQLHQQIIESQQQHTEKCIASHTKQSGAGDMEVTRSEIQTRIDMIEKQIQALSGSAKATKDMILNGKAEISAKTELFHASLAQKISRHVAMNQQKDDARFEELKRQLTNMIQDQLSEAFQSIQGFHTKLREEIEEMKGTLKTINAKQSVLGVYFAPDKHHGSRNS